MNCCHCNKVIRDWNILKYKGKQYLICEDCSNEECIFTFKKNLELINLWKDYYNAIDRYDRIYSGERYLFRCGKLVDKYKRKEKELIEKQKGYERPKIHFMKDGEYLLRYLY